ncbi:MAG: prepilin-type N-terminal cleavage/methylation domain-containing protein [Nitrospiria bacterium]
MRSRKGFTMVEVVVVIGVVALLAGVMVPLISKNLEDAKVARAKNEAVVLAAAIGNLYKDTGFWPSTNRNGPSGGVDRLASNVNKVPRGQARGAGSAARNWGRFGSVKALDDFLYYNNPDDNRGSGAQNERNQDYPTSGEFKWGGPYIEKPNVVDPWGNAYMVNARYFSGNPRYNGPKKHRVYVLSAGPNKVWDTSFSDNVGDGRDEIGGDDVGVTVALR